MIYLLQVVGGCPDHGGAMGGPYWIRTGGNGGMFRISLCVFSVVAAGSTEPPLHNTRSGGLVDHTARYVRTCVSVRNWLASFVARADTRIRGFFKFTKRIGVSMATRRDNSR
jgi:hypothetical protein